MLQSILISFVILCCIIIQCRAADCRSNITITRQPVEHLPPCNPIDVEIKLSCELNTSSPTNLAIQWYRSLGPGEPADLLSDRDPQAYQVNGIITANYIFNSLVFTVTTDTFGFYWCSFDGYNPSTVIPICPATMSTSAVQCTDDEMFITHEEPAQCVIPASSTMPNITQYCITPSVSSTHLGTHSITPSISSSNIITSNIDISSMLTESVSVSVSSAATNQQSISIILISLIVVCILLGCIATMIIVAISVLCYITKKGNRCSKEVIEENKPPTVDATISNNEFYHNGKQDITGPSFSNPVYDINIVVSPNQPPNTLIPNQPPNTLIPNTLISTLPIFSDTEQINGVCYAKPDMSKKRSQSVTTKSQSGTPPPLNNEIMYDIPNIIPDQPVAVPIITRNTNGVYSYPDNTDPDYTDPDDDNNHNKTDPSYEDPWETLPSSAAILRSRESTRSYSYQPNGGSHGNNNNNNTSSMFDDPTYDIPHVT